MENASKALIIAGAILLAILLISLGIMIFNQAQEVVTGSGMDEAQKTAFNNKFVKYEGTQKGTMVKALIQEIIASNSSNENENRQINITGKTTTISSSAFENNKSYTVKITEYDKGLVKTIDIQ